MKTILLALLLSSSAFAQQFTVQTPITVVCPGQPATTSGSNVYTCPGGIIPPKCPSPPGAGPCPPPPGVVFISDILFNGVQLDAVGVTNTTSYSYGRVTIPAGHTGQLAAITVLTNTVSAWRQVTLSKAPGDFSCTSAPCFVQGINASIYVAFETVQPNAVTVLPGSVWYLNTRNQLPFGGGPSCTQAECGYSVRAYPPS